MAKYNIAVNADDDHLTRAVINFSASGDNLIISGIAGQVVRVYRLFTVNASATNITVKSSGGTALSGPLPMLANGSIVFDFDTKAWFTSLPGEGIVINSTNAVQISGGADYVAK